MGWLRQSLLELLEQKILVVEFLDRLARCSQMLSHHPAPSSLMGPAQSSLQRVMAFVEQGQLRTLDPLLADLAEQQALWDHAWWVALRSQQPWPALPLTPEAVAWRVVRQGGWNRITWSCPECGWEMGLQVECEPWDQITWPGPPSCALCSPSP